MAGRAVLPRLMTPAEILTRRLQQQRLGDTPFASLEALFAALGAVQSQDYFGALWALHLRTGLDRAALEAAFNSGTMLRTHVLRPTWHFVAPADLRWMLALTGPRVKAFGASMERKLGIDDRVVARANDVIARTIGDGPPVTRDVLADALRRAKFDVSENRFVHLLMRAELDTVIISGPRVGKQHTYAAFDSRVPRSEPWSRERALVELARRYFATRGPATLHDFAWWSGLTIGDGRAAVAALGTELETREIDGRSHWFAPGSAPKRAGRGAVYLLPNYDEYGIGYRDRSVLLGSAVRMPGDPGLRHFFVVDGVVRGTWDATTTAREASVRFQSHTPLPTTVSGRLQRAAKEHAEFLGLPLGDVTPPTPAARRRR